MQRLIAIPKEETKGKEAEEKDAAASAALKAAGLQPVSKDKLLDPRAGSFQHLPKLDTFVVKTGSDSLTEQVIDLLDETHTILPSITLTAPRPMMGRIFSRRPAQTNPWPEESGIQKAHKAGLTGKGVLVGILDTGIDADHLEFRQRQIDYRYVPLDPAIDRLRIVRGFDVDGHGTHVCGILAGKTIGIAPDVDLMVASVIESETLKTTLDRVLTALDWMLQVIDKPKYKDKPAIINMSLGFVPQSLTDEQVRIVGELLDRMVTTLLQTLNVLPVVAIGNDGPGHVRAPGYFRQALSVGAVNFSGQPAEFSGGGLSEVTGEIEPDIAGYGVDIVSSLERSIDGRSVYASMSGTSMAAPYVTAIAALYASQNPSLQGEALRRYLMEHALPLSSPRDRVGAGLARFV
ncbi:MAG: S8/S53 family peptidase [Caldilineaceae bacterium]